MSTRGNAVERAEQPKPEALPPQAFGWVRMTHAGSGHVRFTRGPRSALKTTLTDHTVLRRILVAYLLFWSC
jgi:hypothetical protein